KGSKDKFQIIKNIKGNDHAVTYYAVRDKNENYLGVLETVQDLSFYKSYLEIWDKAKKK
ncbi:MAG: PAS domain-containing protein, partial [Anaerococcus vaginalis]|nr:PAS domain-containing protein [Anaerococcus vaginalis]